jgi:hypothetical protein
MRAIMVDVNTAKLGAQLVKRDAAAQLTANLRCWRASLNEFEGSHGLTVRSS